MLDQADLERIVRNFTDQNVTYIKVAATDIDGILRGKYIHLEKFKSALKKGFGFCNVVFGWDSGDVCYTNSSYTGWHSGYPDAEARLDPSTLRQVPWDDGNPFFLADFVDAQNKPLPVCPRQLLKKVVSDLETEGFTAKVGCEFEWFNFKESTPTLEDKQFRNLDTIDKGMFGYSVIRMSSHHEFFKRLLHQMESFRIPLEGLHTETGPGVLEAAILACSPVEAADRAVLFKTGVKEIGGALGIMPTFMARWHNDLPGSSGHLHQSLMDLQGKPLCYDESDPYRMSKLFRSYLAGQIKYLPEWLPMVAPTVNSFKRLVPGYWAPTSATWGEDNRTCAFRVIAQSAASARVEVRVPGADMNPYLSIAASLAAGLRGIKEGLDLTQKPVVGNGYEDTDATAFPSNLHDATRRFEQSEAAKESLGEHFVDHFCRTRRWEWEQSQKAVTDWELRRYFEII